MWVKIKPSSKDILLIFTNSGVNQAPIEASYIAKKLKCKTVGVSSESYSKIAKKSKYNKRLSEVVDYHFDNYGPPGDALIEIKKNFNVSPFSTIAGSFILNSIISEVAELAKNLMSHRGRSIISVGNSHSKNIHKLVHYLNIALNNINNTVFFKYFSFI